MSAMQSLLEAFATASPLRPHPSSAIAVQTKHSLAQYTINDMPSTRSSFQESLASHEGTTENPLVPKRRRRTTPAELEILERYFIENPLPKQDERAVMAVELGMSARALQVWFQNRRQKEKKDSGASYPPSSASSSVRDSTSEAGDYFDERSTTEMSFVPPPLLPFSHAMRGPSPLAAFPSPALPSPAMTIGKENSQSYFSRAESMPPIARPPFASETDDLIKPSTNLSSTPLAPYLHRSSTTSIITAKKHIRKRPLGAHAPMARTPSLEHTFAFPASPPRNATRPPLVQRRSSSALLSMTTSGRAICVDAREEETTTMKQTRKGSSVWEHMASDPVSPHSNPASFFWNGNRPRLQHAQSMPCVPTLSTTARIQGEDACAQVALGLKRARMVSESTPPEDSTGGRSKRRKSKPELYKLETVVTKGRSSRTVTKAKPKPKRSSTGSSTSSSCASDMLANSSFSSAGTMDTSFESVGSVHKAESVDERECAELLLGLGGFK